MAKEIKNNIQKVQDKLKELGFSYQVIELPQTTHTALDAASALSCKLGQIAKSIIFKSKNSNQPILVIASGSNQINEKKIREYIAESIEKADADFVLKQTGFVIGGVAPISNLKKITTFIDKDLFQYNEIWAAAGSPKAVFKLKPKDLIKMTNGQIVSIK